MIQSCTICYNDGPNLIKDCLNSVKNKVDKILVIDGVFQNFPRKESEKIQSTDGTLEVAKELADTVIETKEPWINQMNKRNAYLTLESTNDYYFILDADERLEGELPKDLTKDFYGIKIIDPRIPESVQANNYQVRLFRHQTGLKYKKKHSWLWLKEKICSLNDFNDNIVKLDTCKIIHEPYRRGDNRQVQDTIYTKERSEPDHPTVTAQPVQVDKPIVSKIKVKALKAYNGFDIDTSIIFVKENELFECTQKKWEQLKEDYPNNFTLVEN